MGIYRMVFNSIRNLYLRIQALEKKEQENNAQQQELIDGIVHTGITPSQANAIIENSAKKGISPSQESQIESNKSEISTIKSNMITPAQRNNITKNTAKIGITNDQ